MARLPNERWPVNRISRTRIAPGATNKETAAMPNQIPEKIALELDELFRAAQDEQADIRRLEQRVMKSMTEAALQEFPVLKNMSSEQIRKFGDSVSRLSCDFAIRVASLAYAAEQEG
jgi:hypothetical protein